MKKLAQIIAGLLGALICALSLFLIIGVAVCFLLPIWLVFTISFMDWVIRKKRSVRAPRIVWIWLHAISAVLLIFFLSRPARVFNVISGFDAPPGVSLIDGRRIWLSGPVWEVKIRCERAVFTQIIAAILARENADNGGNNAPGEAAVSPLFDAQNPLPLVNLEVHRDGRLRLLELWWNKDSTYGLRLRSLEDD